jgi:hypothetical protein
MLDTASVKLKFASSASAANNFVIFLDDADYITFEHLTIWRTGTNNYAQLVDMSNGATHNAFRDCRLIGTSAVSTTIFTALIGSTNMQEDSYNVFDGNNFEGGAYAFYFLGRGSSMLDAGLEITNNVFINQNFKGIYITCQDAALITGNTITTNSANNNYYGIYGQYANNELQIVKNKLALSTGYGIYLTNSEGISGAELLIANNFISISGASTNYGIYLNQLKSTNIYYNSVNLYTSTSGRALNITGVTSQLNHVLNNVFCNTGGGYAIYVDPTTGTPMAECNYNDLYTTGANVGYWKSSADQALLSNWQATTSFDANSVSTDPLFVSATDLHAESGLINSMATINLSSQTPVNDDIDGQPRNAITPDIGADEFYVEDIGISSLGMDPSYCQNTTATIKVYIKNFTLYPFVGTVPVYYQLNGGSIVNAVTGSLSIAAGDSSLYTFAGQVSLPDSGNVPLVCGTSLGIDTDPSNDTLFSGFINVLPAPLADAGYDLYPCLGDSAELTASGGVSYLWNTLPPETTAIIHVLVTDTTEYIVQVTGANGCLASDTVLVIPGIYPTPVADFSFSVFDMEVTFTDLSTDAYGWDWDFGDGNFSTEQNPVHVYTANGNYNVKLIGYNGCGGDTATKSITVIGIDEISGDVSIQLSPNPAGGLVRITSPGNLLSRICVFDMQGRLLISLAELQNGLLNVSELQSGIYSVTIETTQGLAVKKLVIRK